VASDNTVFPTLAKMNVVRTRREYPERYLKGRCRGKFLGIFYLDRIFGVYQNSVWSVSIGGN
jgi:hypothetical protein